MRRDERHPGGQARRARGEVGDEEPGREVGAAHHVLDEEEHERRRNRGGDAVQHEDGGQAPEEPVAKWQGERAEERRAGRRQPRVRRGGAADRHDRGRDDKRREGDREQREPGALARGLPQRLGKRRREENARQREALAPGGDARALRDVVGDLRAVRLVAHRDHAEREVDEDEVRREPPRDRAGCRGRRIEQAQHAEREKRRARADEGPPAAAARSRAVAPPPEQRDPARRPGGAPRAGSRRRPRGRAPSCRHRISARARRWAAPPWRAAARAPRRPRAARSRESPPSRPLPVEAQHLRAKLRLGGAGIEPDARRRRGRIPGRPPRRGSGPGCRSAPPCRAGSAPTSRSPGLMSGKTRSIAASQRARLRASV